MPPLGSYFSEFFLDIFTKQNGFENVCPNGGQNGPHWAYIFKSISMCSEKYNMCIDPTVRCVTCFCVQVGFDMQPTAETPLLEVLKLGLEKYLDELSAISSQASKEYALEKVSQCYPAKRALSAMRKHGR